MRGPGTTTFAQFLGSALPSQEATVDAIAQRPLQFSVVHRGGRRAGVRRFPYGIFFEVQETRIVVIACFHSKRDPSQWRAR